MLWETGTYLFRYLSDLEKELKQNLCENHNNLFVSEWDASVMAARNMGQCRRFCHYILCLAKSFSELMFQLQDSISFIYLFMFKQYFDSSKLKKVASYSMIIDRYKLLNENMGFLRLYCTFGYLDKKDIEGISSLLVRGVDKQH